MENKLFKCPNCGNTKFKANNTFTEIFDINISSAGAEYVNKQMIGIPNTDTPFADKEFICTNCNNKVVGKSIMPDMEKCSMCGELINKESIVDGLCPACKEISSTGKSATELLRELLSGGKKAETETVQEDKPRKRRASRKKTTEEALQQEVRVPEETEEKDITEPSDGFMNAPVSEDTETAPFPDTDDLFGNNDNDNWLNKQSEEKGQKATSTANFSMYDDDDGDEEDDTDDADDDNDDEDEGLF